MKNKYIIVIFGLLVILGILYAVSIFLFGSKQPGQLIPSLRQPTPTTFIPAKNRPTPATIEEMQKDRETTYTQNQNKVNEKEKEFYNQESKVGLLLYQVPYQGTNFSITHDYSKAQFIVTIPPDKQNEGNSELNTWLKSKGVERSWIRSELLVFQ